MSASGPSGPLVLEKRGRSKVVLTVTYNVILICYVFSSPDPKVRFCDRFLSAVCKLLFKYLLNHWSKFEIISEKCSP